MISKKLKTLAKEEAQNLRIHATKDERMKLDFSELDGGAPHLCVYGQMTNDCFSIRAAELLNKCTKPYSKFVSCITKTDRLSFAFRGADRGFSPIEVIICQNRADINKNLIEFLREETDEFIF